MGADLSIHIDPDRTRFGVVVDSLEAHFPAITGFAEPAKGAARADALVAVDPAHAGADVRRHAVGSLQVARPYAAPQAIGRAVSDGQRLLLAGEAQHGDEGAEYFLLRHPMVYWGSIVS